MIRTMRTLCGRCGSFYTREVDLCRLHAALTLHPDLPNTTCSQTNHELRGLMRSHRFNEEGCAFSCLTSLLILCHYLCLSSFLILFLTSFSFRAAISLFPSHLLLQCVQHLPVCHFFVFTSPERLTFRIWKAFT